MKCEKCDTQIEEGEERKHSDQILCEDCYIDVITPAKACDPWAVYTAKSMTNESSALTELQEKIIKTLSETNGIEPEVLAKKLNIKIDDLQRELATLRHMEKIRASMKNDKIVICLW